jgi:hypothetical protein
MKRPRLPLHLTLGLTLALAGVAGCVPSAPGGQSAPAPAPVTAPALAAAPAPPPSGSWATPFAASSPWNTPIGSTVAWRDEPALRADHWWLNYESYSIPVVEGAASDPLVAVSVPESWGWPGGTLHVHVPAAVTGADGTDGALVVVSDGIAYNFWQFTRVDATHAGAVAYGEANIASGTGFGTASPFLGAGIRAAGSSGLAGLITGADTASGTVLHHALAVSLLGAELRDGFVAPAIAQDGGGGYTGTIPMGARLGVPAGTAMPAGLSAFGQSIWNTLVTYGAFVVDRHGGTAPVQLYADPFSVASGPIETARVYWNGAPSDLDRIMPYVRVVR